MRILMLTDNYVPEMNANARIFSELAELWASEEQSVSVITSHPNFPKGKIFNGYKNKWITKTLLHGVNVIRVKTYMHANIGFFKRTLDFLSFGLSSFFFGLFQKNPNVIIGVTPQFFCALSACLLSILKRKPFVMILCDLWPDSIISNNLMHKGFLYRLIKKIEIWMYQKSKKIVILSRHFRGYLNNLGIQNEKIITSISGASRQFYPRKKNKKILANYGLHNQFIIGYIGTFGISHNLEDILLVASSLQKRGNDDIHFLIIGDGAKREKLLQQKDSLKLDNVTIDGPFCGDSIPDYWSIINTAIVPLADTETNKTVLPSKMFEAMSMGIPIILYTPDGEAKTILNSAQAGWYVKTGEINKLEILIKKISQKDYCILEQQDNAVKFAKSFSREQQSKQLLAHIQLLHNY